MGTRFPVRWKLLLFPFCLLLVAFAGAVPVQAAEDTLGVPEVAGAPKVDGVLDDAYWTGAQAYTLDFDGTLDAEVTRSVTLRLLHNGTHLFVAMSFKPGGGTHPDDFVLLTFDPDNGAEAPAGRTDLLRYGWAYPTLLDDKVWDGELWRRDADAGCETSGDAARTETDRTWHYEISKPLSGDDCDLRTTPGATVGMRFEFRENMPAPMHGDDFRWPRGTTYMDVTGNDNGRLDEAAAWADVRLAGTAPEQAGGASDDPSNRTSNGTSNGSWSSGDGSGGTDASDPGNGAVTDGDGVTGEQGQGSGDPADPEGDGAAEAPTLPAVVTVAVLGFVGVAGRRRS